MHSPQLLQDRAQLGGRKERVELMECCRILQIDRLLVITLPNQRIFSPAGLRIPTNPISRSGRTRSQIGAKRRLSFQEVSPAQVLLRL